MANKEYRDSFVAGNLSNTVAAQIHSLREKQQWTQSQLAEKTGMKQSRISAMEDPDTENFEIKTLLRFAAAFDVALMVRFVPFSELLRRAVEAGEADFLIPSYDADMGCRQVGTTTPSAATTSHYQFKAQPRPGDFGSSSGYVAAGASALVRGLSKGPDTAMSPLVVHDTRFYIASVPASP